MSLARRNLFHDRTRFALSVGGIALSIMLILLLNGFFSGLYRQVLLYLDMAPGTVVVAQSGVSNFLAATSLLPPGTDVAVRGTSGVAGVVPITFQSTVLDLHGKKVFVYLVGYEPGMGGGPWKLAEGREPQADDEVVLDRVLAQRHGLARGDSFEILDRRFTVSGLSDGTAGFMASFVFVRKTAAEALLRAPAATSFLLVTPAAGATPAAVVDELNRTLAATGAEALLKQEVAANDQKLIARIYGAALRLMVGVAFLVGTLVVGLVIYTATVERQREYGVLKAIGARNTTLYRVVSIQALIAAGAGSLAGVGLVFGAAWLIMALRPQFLIVVEPDAIVRALLAGIMMALLAALFPARIIAGLAPADVFRR